MLRPAAEHELPLDRLRQRLNPTLRQQVLQCLLDQLGRLLRITRQQVQQVQQHCRMPHAGRDRVTSTACEAADANHVVLGLAGLLRAFLDEQHGQKAAASTQIPPTSVATGMNHPACTATRGEEETASAGSPIQGNASVRAGRRLDDTCATLDGVLDDYLMSTTEVDDRCGILRELIIRVLRGLHEDVSRLRILLQVISRRLPLPNLLEDTTMEQNKHATILARLLRQHLQGVQGHVSEPAHTMPMDQSWATEQVPTLGPFAMDTSRDTWPLKPLRKRPKIVKTVMNTSRGMIVFETSQASKSLC